MTPNPPLTLSPWAPRSCPCGTPITARSRGRCARCARRARKRGRRPQRRKAHFKRDTLILASHESMGGKGCNSGPGLCLVYRCLENAVLDYTVTGNLHVPATPGRHEAYTPPPSSSSVEEEGRVRAALQRAVRVRTHWLLEEYGTTCTRDLIGPAKQSTVGRVMGWSRQRVEQIERAARGSEELRKVVGEAAGVEVETRWLAEGCRRR